MIIESLTLYNVGPYRGRVEIPLAPKPGRPLTLINARNGSGKTTLIDAISLALYGAVAQLHKRGRVPYRQYLSELIWSGRGARENEALVTLRYRYTHGGQCRLEEITRRWTRSGNEHAEISVLNNRGEWHIDEGLKNELSDHIDELLPADLAPFFFFDGELILEFADRERCAPVLRRAVDGLFGLTLLTKLDADLGVWADRQRLRHRDTELDSLRLEGQGLQNELHQAEQRRQEARQALAAAEDEFQQAQERLLEAEEKLRQCGGDLFERKREIEQAYADAKAALRQAKQNQLALLAGQAPLRLVQSRLLALRARVQTEMQLRRNRDLLDALYMRDQEIVQRLAVQFESEVVERVSKVLTEDRCQREKALHSSEGVRWLDEDMQKAILACDHDWFLSLSESIRVAFSALYNAELAVQESECRLKTVPDPEAMHDLIAQRAKCQEQLEQATKRRQEAKDAYEKAQQLYDRIAERYRRVMDRLAASDHEDRNLERRLACATGVREVLKTLRQRVLKPRLSSLENQIEQAFAKLAADDADLVNKVHIDPQTYELTVIDTYGELITLERFSAGQKQLLATAILWGIMREFGKAMPVVIDTPLGRMSADNRRRMVEHYYPQASSQVVLLSTDTEIVGPLRKVLEPKMARSIELIHRQRCTIAEIDEA